MRKVAMLAAVAMTAVTVSPAWAAERNFTVSNFDEIESKGPFDVIVSVGKGVSVRAVGEAKDLDRLAIRVEGRELRIGTKERGWFDWSDSDPIKIYVTVPALKAVALAGSGDIQVDRVKADHFAGSIAGSGDLVIGSLTATSTKLSIAGSGDLTVNGGTCRSADISIAGSGDVRAPAVRCQMLSANVAGSGNINANASGGAKVSIMGSGDVVVAGGAKCDIRTMGSGTVRCG